MLQHVVLEDWRTGRGKTTHHEISEHLLQLQERGLVLDVLCILQHTEPDNENQPGW